MFPFVYLNYKIFFLDYWKKVQVQHFYSRFNKLDAYYKCKATFIENFLDLKKNASKRQLFFLNSGISIIDLESKWSGMSVKLITMKNLGH